MPIWTREMPHRTLRRGKRNARTDTIPEGDAFDIWEILERSSEVRVRTVDNILITLTRTGDTTLHARRNVISGLNISVEFMGTRKIFDGWCQRHCSVWRQINPYRVGLRWRFGHVESVEHHAIELESGAVCINHVRGT